MLFTSKNVIYIAAYNNSNNLVNLLDSINEISFNFDILFIDDNSTDNTYEVVKNYYLHKKINKNVNLLKNKKNYGYAGSQKIAYSLLREQESVKNIIMLHGDGQYVPKLINKFKEYLDSDYSIIQGYRNKIIYPNEDQTPFIPYYIIKILNYYENTILNLSVKEWHSGFVMYDKNFLKKIQIDALINTPHIDGNILYVSKLLKAKVVSIPIYKKYKNKNNYNFLMIFKYLLSVIYLPFLFMIDGKNYLRSKKTIINYEYDVTLIRKKIN